MRALPAVVRSVLFAFVGLLLLGDRVALSAESGLVLELRPAKPVVVLGEPVYVTAVMRNRGPASVAVVPVLDLEASLLRYFVEDPAGEVRRYETWGEASIAATPQLLYPGDEIIATHMVWWQPRGGGAFPVPGDYGLTATFEDGRHSLRSNRVVLHVVAPQGEEAAALPLMLGEEQGEFIHVGSYQLQEGMKKLRELVEKHPRSTYAPHAEYALALRASRKGWYCPEPGSGRLDRTPPDYPQAINGFQRIVRDYPDSALADDAQYELARTYRDKGDRGAAALALNVFLDRFAADSNRSIEAIGLAEDLGWASGNVPPPPSGVAWVELEKVALGEGVTVSWVKPDEESQISRPGTAIALQSESPVATLGSRRLPLVAPARVKNGQMLVPISFAALLPRLLRQARQLDPIPVRDSRPSGE